MNIVMLSAGYRLLHCCSTWFDKYCLQVTACFTVGVPDLINIVCRLPPVPHRDVLGRPGDGRTVGVPDLPRRGNAPPVGQCGHLHTCRPALRSVESHGDKINIRNYYIEEKKVRRFGLLFGQFKAIENKQIWRFCYVELLHEIHLQNNSCYQICFIVTTG